MWHGITINFFIWGIVHSLFWCISYYFHKKNYKILNYFILFFGVIIGRIIFSEINTDFLFIKIKTLFDFTKWKFNVINEFPFGEIGKIDLSNISVSISLILLEIIMPRYFTKYKNNYYYLRSPIVSTLILVYIFLFFRGLNFEPIYGGR